VDCLKYICRKTIEKIKAGELEADHATSQTAQDQEDLWAAEFKGFTPASRKTGKFYALIMIALEMKLN
jgi:hypothetical protein